MRVTSGAVPLPLLVVAALFALAIAWLVVSSFAPRNVATFSPVEETPPTGAFVTDTVTLDARDAARWTWFAFGRGRLELPDTAGWDVAARRFKVITGAPVARLEQAFDSVITVPAAGYVATTWARDTANAAVTRWYRYDFLSHLLKPAPATYVLAARAGGHAKLEFLSYYCPGPEPGCLTFRYVYRADASRAF